MRSRPGIVLFAVLALAAASCSGDDGAGTPAGPETTDASPASSDTDPAPGGDSPDEPPPEPVAASFAVRASAGQVTVTDAEPGAELRLRSSDGEEVMTKTVDGSGNLLFRNVEPGDGYAVADASSTPPSVSETLRVPPLDEHPDPSFYEGQEIGEGFGYIEMRDGTLLAATVRLPGPIEDGPYPTVVEYSGYDPASPYEVEPTIGVYGQLGYATVGVNMRGSGCSGGTFDFFEPLQAIDGYDVIEAIAAQDWVYGNHVGMVGVSYSGISQLFVAATQPPSLAAITPLSVIEDAYRSVVYPGGIYNNGFAKSWGDARQGANDAYGQEWVIRRVEEGDSICDANQHLRSQNRDLTQLAAESAFYDAERGDPLAPRTFVDRITVPTFLAGAWQDEQTGGRFATMLDDFTGTDVLKVHLYNGAHADSLGPESLVRAAELLDVYVAERTPRIDPAIRVAAPLLYREVFGADGLVPPPDRFASLEEARATIEREPPIRVLLEMGANETSPGGPLSRDEVLFESWPPPEARATTWDLAALAGGERVGRFRVDVGRSQELTERAEGDDDGNEFDDLQWAPLEAGGALVFETAAFTDDVLLLGPGRVTLRIQADEPDADLQVTISEVRPDGNEMYVQSGWLRASHRALDETETTAVLPWHLHTEEARADLPAGEFTEVDVELFPAGHVFRAGSRLRLVVDSPGGTRNLWAFDVLPNDGSTIRVDPSGSTLTLPFVADVAVPQGLPDCENTRSQPCRVWEAYDNEPVG